MPFTIELRAQEIIKYYLKDFVARLAGIKSASIYYSLLPVPEKEHHVYATLQELEDFYSTIPFRELNEKDDLKPLFEVRELLPELRKNIDNFFEQGASEALPKIKDLVGKITNTGRVYFRNFNIILDEISTYSNGNETKLQLLMATYKK